MSDKKSELIAKALKDPKFKSELLANPAAVIEKATGVKVPAGVTVKIVEDSSSVVHLVLPVLAAAPKGELSDKELEKAAGGASGLPATLVMRSSPCDNTSPVLGRC